MPPSEKVLTRNEQICLVAMTAEHATDGAGQAAAVLLIAAVNHARGAGIRREVFLAMLGEVWEQIEQEEKSYSEACKARG